ncbi:MAG: GDP-mannose 4,6-dehydratase [Deltaproteobacteria bacterium]|nr:GDP-mannose 4,6-dehydratase [Deltaproteobacteria bacterium]
MNKKRALITGIAGQDGSYLVELLLGKGYEVYGFVRRSGFENFERIKHVKDRISFVQGDLTDQSSIDEAIKKARPDEIYNLASQSFIPLSWEHPVLTADINATGVARLLESIRKFKSDARFYQASSSEMFGNAKKSPQDEKTPFNPRNPYGAAKVYAYWLTKNYREKYNMFACSGILFNHESPRRDMEYVTRKIANGAAAIKLGLQKEIRLGSLDAKRDWGFAEDYVKAMWLMLQQDIPDDYVIATGRTHTVKYFVETAFEYAGLNWKDYVVIDPALVRLPEETILVGNPKKAMEKLGWKPNVSFKDMVEIMVKADIESLKNRQA